MKISGQGADHYGNGQPQDCSCSLPHGTAADHTGNPPCDCGAGVNLPDQDIRGFSCHNISEDSAAYSGEHPYKDKEEGIVWGRILEAV